MMGKIYAQALNVKIWLGKEDKESPEFVAIRNTHGGASVLSSFHIGTYGRTPIVLSFLAQALRNANGPKNRLAAIRPMEDSAHRNLAYGFPPPEHRPKARLLRSQYYLRGVHVDSLRILSKHSF
jgi:hypothetical protein